MFGSLSSFAFKKKVVWLTGFVSFNIPGSRTEKQVCSVLSLEVCHSSGLKKIVHIPQHSHLEFRIETVCSPYQFTRILKCSNLLVYVPFYQINPDVQTRQSPSLRLTPVLRRSDLSSDHTGHVCGQNKTLTQIDGAFSSRMLRAQAAQFI